MKYLLIAVLSPIAVEAQTFNFPSANPQQQQPNVIVVQPQPRNNLQQQQDMILQNEYIKKLQIENRAAQPSYGMGEGNTTGGYEIVEQPAPNLFGNQPNNFRVGQ